MKSGQETRWTFYTDVESAWQAMLDACRQAQDSIDLEQFIFINDIIGAKFVEVITERAKAGVKVRILLDAAGSFDIRKFNFIKDIQNHGIQVRFFGSLIPRTPWNHRLWFLRNHRRALIIDANTVKAHAFTGGICVLDEARSWRETHISFTGPMVIDIDNAFEIMWRKALRDKNEEKIWNKPTSFTQDGFKYTTLSPRLGKRYLYHELIDAMRNAKRYIYITTPYFSPDHRVIRILRLAARKKIAVKIILPESSDHFIVDLAGQSFYTSLLTNGVEIYRYHTTFIHAKSVIIDGEWATIGSMNMDNISLRYNFEANIVSHNKTFIQELLGHFLADLSHAEPVSVERWLRRGWIRQILEVLIVPLRPFL